MSVVLFPVKSSRANATTLLNAASNEELEAVLIIGRTADGEPYYSCNTEGPDALWLLKRFERFLLDEEPDPSGIG